MTSNQSAEIFMNHVEAIPADDKCYQIFLHVEEDTHPISRALEVIELSGADLHSLSVQPSPVVNKKILILKFNDRDLKNVVIDFIRSGYLEVKGCGPRSFSERA
jgi:hypothetical protein